jgi:hypothetical protein
MDAIKLSQPIVDRFERRWTTRFAQMLEQRIAAVIERWLRIQSSGIPEEPAQGRLL